MVRQRYKVASSLSNLSRLPKIKGWIDTNNPGDPLIPFSVELEERLSLSGEEKAADQKEGAQSALGKITQAGYASLDVRDPKDPPRLHSRPLSLFDTLPVGLTKSGHGRSGGAPRHPRLLVSFSTFFYTRITDRHHSTSILCLARTLRTNSFVAKSCPMMTSKSTAAKQL